MIGIGFVDCFSKKHMLQIYVLNNKVAIEQSINFSGLINLEISQLRHMTFFSKIRLLLILSLYIRQIGISLF